MPHSIEHDFLDQSRVRGRQFNILPLHQLAGNFTGRQRRISISQRIQNQPLGFTMREILVPDS